MNRLDAQGPAGNVGKVTLETAAPPQPKLRKIDVPTLAQIVSEELAALELAIPDGLEYALAQRIARRMEQC
jgi:hypothetical protein